MNFNNGMIENCTTSNVGGGIYLTANESSSTLRLAGTTIRNCEAYSGGGVFLTNGLLDEDITTTVQMTGGLIEACSAAFGGGFYLNHSMVFMSGGAISGCDASNGGGIVLYNNSTLNLSSTATITNCTALSGWGISFDSSQGSINCDVGTNVEDYIQGFDANAVHDDNA